MTGATGQPAITVGPLLVLVLVALTALGAVTVWTGRLGGGWRVVTAAARAAVQLGVVSLVIAVVLNRPPLTAAFVLLMFVVASATAARRVTGHRSGLWVAAPIAAGVAPVLAMLLGSGLVPTRGIAVVPIGGILIGGAMTATSLAGRRALDELHARYGEYEAALSIGLLPRDAAMLVCRPSASQALVPALDQTRTVGLVTLPGAFVGVLLAGASPAQAAAVQVLVLIALLAVESVAVLVTVELVAMDRVRRGPGRVTRS